MRGDPDILKSYLEHKKIRVFDVIKVSHESAKFSSFKDDDQNMLDENFWPQGLRC